MPTRETTAFGNWLPDPEGKCHITKAPLPIRCRAYVTSGAPQPSFGLYMGINIYSLDLVHCTIHARTLKNMLPFPVHVAGVLDQNRPGRAFLRPTLSGDVPSLPLDYGKNCTGPPDHRTSFLEVATSSSSVRSAGVDRA